MTARKDGQPRKTVPGEYFIAVVNDAGVTHMLKADKELKGTPAARDWIKSNWEKYRDLGSDFVIGKITRRLKIQPKPQITELNPPKATATAAE